VGDACALHMMLVDDQKLPSIVLLGVLSFFIWTGVCWLLVGGLSQIGHLFFSFLSSP
jgi:hypothetical protein